MAESKSKEKFDIKHTFLIGLAFFTTGISWSLYNTRVNQQLDDYFAGFVLAGLAVGILMAVDNILGVIIQPIMGTVSDNTRSKYGRRIPYIIVGVICSAIFFALIPTGFLPTGTLPILLIWMFFFSLSMGFYRSQAVSLMPDFVKPQHRSKANAIINIMGGIGAIVAYTMGLASGALGLQWIFIIASIIMVVALVVLVLTVNENDAYSYKLLLEAEAKEGKVKEKKEKVGLIKSFKDILNEEDKSTLFILLAIFAWFIGYQGLEAFFSIYAATGTNGILNQTDAFASFMFNFVAIPFIIAAFPLSLLASRIGRKRCIQIGLIIMILSMLVGFLIQTLTVTMIVLVLFGIGWAFVNVNSIVIVWELAPSVKKIGTYTGLYYFFSVLAAIIGPGIVGGLRDLFGPGSLLLDGLIFFVIAFILVFFVKRGEVELKDEEKLARKKAIEEL